MDNDPKIESAVRTKPVPYGLIWFLNSAVTLIVFWFLFCTDMMTLNFLELEDVLLLGLIALLATVPVVAVETLIFFGVKRCAGRKHWPAAKIIKWLLAPSWVFAAVLLGSALWSLTPHARLTKVCRGTSIQAHNIQVVGMTGLQMGAWLAGFETDRAGFEKLIQSQHMQLDTSNSVPDEFSRLFMVRRTTLYSQLSEMTNLPSYQNKYIGVDGNVHGGIYAIFNPTNSNAMVFTTGY